MRRFFLLITLVCTLALRPFGAVAAIDEQAAVKEEKKINPKEIIFEHLTDGYGWEVPFSHELRIPMPVIVRDYQGHWHCFSSSRIQHGETYD